MRLSGQEAEKANASTAAAAAATRGHLRPPRLGFPGIRAARPAPRQAPAMTTEARGRMNASTKLGRKKIGMARATRAGNHAPRGVENDLKAPPVMESAR